MRFIHLIICYRENKEDENKPPDTQSANSWLDDEEYIVEYDRDIIFDKINKKIEELIKKEPKNIKDAVELINIIKFDRNEVVIIDGNQYHVMSKEGLDKINEFEFSNLKSKYNILPTMFKWKDNPVVIEFVDTHRNWFAIWAFAAMHIDHNQFRKFIYHTLVNYKSETNDINNILPFKINQIEPMTYAKFVYEVGIAMLKFNSSLYNMMKEKNLVGIQSEHWIECFYYR